MFLDFLEKREETTDSITLTDEEKIFLKVFGIDSEQPAAAMREATYFTCIKQLSEAVAKTPLYLVQDTENGIRRATEERLNELLLSYSEWQQAAYGSPQGADGNNTNAWAATTNTARTTTGKVVNAVSAIGCVDCVGNVWEWLDELSYRYDGTQSWSWKDVLGTGNGQAYTEGTYGLVRLFAGGGWSNGVSAGCRAVRCGNFPWDVHASIGARFGCDSL